MAVTWAKSNPLAAFAWAADQGISLTDRVDSDGDVRMVFADLGYPLLAGTKDKDSAAVTLNWVQTLPPGPDRDRYLELTMRFVNPDLLAGLVTQLPIDAAKLAAQMYASPYGSEPQIAWAMTLSGDVRLAALAAIGARINDLRELPIQVPPGPDRDAILRGMALKENQEPQVAQEVAKRIGEPKLRQQVLDDLSWLSAKTK